MTIRQIIISIAAVALIAVLYNLPKYVVENEAEETAGQIMQDSGNEPAVAHSDMDQTTALRTARALKEALTEENNKKNLIFADSLAGIYLQLGLVDSAAALASQLNELEAPLDQQITAGNIYYQAFNFAASEENRTEYANRVREIFERVLAEDPDNYAVQTKVAMTYVASTAPMRGILMLRDILEKDPDNEEVIYNLGVLSIQSGQYDKAIERFEKLISLNPNNVEAHFYLALSHYESGNVDEAKALFEKVKEMEDDPTVQATVDDYLKEINS